MGQRVEVRTDPGSRGRRLRHTLPLSCGSKAFAKGPHDTPTVSLTSWSKPDLVRTFRNLSSMGLFLHKTFFFSFLSWSLGCRFDPRDPMSEVRSERSDSVSYRPLSDFGLEGGSHHVPSGREVGSTSFVHTGIRCRCSSFLQKRISMV